MATNTTEDILRSKLAAAETLAEQSEFENITLKACNSELTARNSDLEARNAEVEARNTQIEARNAELENDVKIGLAKAKKAADRAHKFNKALKRLHNMNRALYQCIQKGDIKKASIVQKKMEEQEADIEMLDEDAHEAVADARRNVQDHSDKKLAHKLEDMLLK